MSLSRRANAKKSERKRAPRGALWNREETMLAFNLYSKMPFGKIHDDYPEIVRLAELLGRPPGSLSWKMCNLATSDPQHAGRIKGTRIASMEKAVWEEFSANPDKFMLETEELLRARSGDALDEIETEPAIALLPKGETRARLVETRMCQSLFRRMVLSAYDNRCCITGVSVPELLNASHIVPWAKNENERINPHNGLCLNALHDRAFDRGLITVTPDFVVRISAKLRKMTQKSNKIEFLLESDERKIETPTRFLPDKRFLDFHCREIFQGLE